MIKNRWTKEEIDFLVKTYQSKGGRYVSQTLNRTINSVKNKAKELGLINYTAKAWTDEEIKFLKENYSNNGNKFVCEKLNRNRGSVSKKAKELGLTVDYSPTFTKEELQSAVNESHCISDLVSNLGKTNTGAYQSIIKKYLILYNIDTSHFDPYKKNRERILKGTVQNKFPIEHWLKYGSNIGSSKLKEKLYNEGLKKRECEKCGQGENWMGNKISLILDHINGDPKDNRIENLRILCPNCNAALPTHCRGHKK
jgi:ribosomal protein S27AE